MTALLEANYHSHTFRCGHAGGQDEEYAKAAIDAGFKALGFSDHVILPDRSQSGMRGDPALLEGYIASVSALKEKYKSQIEILLAFECEWYGNEYASYYKQLLTKRGFDYLLLGQHCFLLNGRFAYYCNVADDNLGIELYTKDVISAIESGLFAYVAHPDLYMLWHEKWDEVAIKAAWAICRKAKEKNVPLEINMGPSRRGLKTSVYGDSLYCYPYPKFFEIAREVGNEIIIGVDAHSPHDYGISDYRWALDFASKLGLKPLKRLVLPSFK